MKLGKVFLILICLFGEALSSFAQKLPELIPYYCDGLWGFSDKHKNIVIPCKYDKVEFFKNGLAIVHGNCEMQYIHGDDVACCMVCKKGVIDAKGNLVVPIKYDNINGFNEKGVSIVSLNGKIGVIDKTGKEIVPVIYTTNFLGGKPGYSKLVLNNKFGVMDKEGTIILPVRYDEVRMAEYGYNYPEWKVIEIGLNEKWGFYNPLNGALVSPQFDEFLGRHSAYMRENERFVYTKTNEDIELWDKKSGKRLISGKYDEIKIVSDGRFFELKIKNKKGFANSAGKIIAPVKYDRINHFDNYNFIQASEGNKNDFFDLSGKNIRKNFNRIEHFSGYVTLNKFKIFQKNGKWGLLDSIGKEIIQAKFDTLIHQRDINAIITVHNEKYGLFDKQGKEIVACQYDPIKSYYGYYRNLDLSKAFIVSKNGKKGLINVELRKEVIPCEYDHINNFDSGNDPTIFEVRKDGLIGAISNVGEVIFSPDYQVIGVNSDYGYFVVQYQKNQVGITNMKGEVIIPMEYEEVWSLNTPFILKKYGKYGFVDSLTQKPLTEFKFDFIYVNAFPKRDVVQTRIDKKYGIVNRDGTELVTCEYEKIEIEDNLFFAQNNNKKWGVINLQGKQVQDFIFDNIDKTDWIYKKNQWINVQQNGKWGLLNNKGDVIIKPQYTKIEQNYQSSLINAAKENKWGILDSLENEVFPIQYNQIKHFKNELIALQFNGFWGLRTIQNNEILPYEYEEIEILDGASDDHRALPYESVYVKIKKKEGWGLFHKDNKRELIPPKYHNVYVLSDSLFVADDKYRRIFYNSQGEIIGNLDDENVRRIDDWTITEFYNMLQNKESPLILLERRGYIDLDGNSYYNIKP